MAPSDATGVLESRVAAGARPTVARLAGPEEDRLGRHPQTTWREHTLGMQTPRRDSRLD